MSQSLSNGRSNFRQFFSNGSRTDLRKWLGISIVVFGISSHAETVKTAQDGLSQKVDHSDLIKFEVEKYQLPNGLTVILHVDRSVPIVSFQQWFRVGSRNEKVGRTGIAHFFEHLMFKGTSLFPQGEYDKVIQANGGVNNAFTTREYTGYFTNIPSDKIEKIFEIEADRMVNLVFDPKAIDSEREVVKEERRFRFENRVEGFVFEEIFASVFKTHPYRWPVIGSMEDLNATTKEDFQKFYKTFYSPTNAVVVVAGDIQPSSIKRMIQKYYGKLAKQEIPPYVAAPEAAQKAPREAIFRKSVQNPIVTLAFRGGVLGTPESYALDLVAALLSTGPSSRLYKRLVYQEQAALSVESYSYALSEPGIFVVQATTKANGNPSKVVLALKSELEKLSKELVTPMELEKVKNQVALSYVNGLKTISGKARALAEAEIVTGDYRTLFGHLKSYMAVTPEDIKKVSAQFLQPSSMSTIQVLPKAAL